MSIKAKQTIIGIDPGTNILGFGIVVVENNRIQIKDVGILHMVKEEDAHLKLKAIYQFISDLIKKNKPDSLAIEAPFYGKNVQSMLKLGRAQGVAIAAAMAYDLTVTEYAPRKIKQSITGSGNASKEQVSAMICRMLNLKEPPAFFDETDALAVAVCHSLQNQLPTASAPSTSGKKSSGWSAFIKENPKRLQK
jgi:crossover junction endodeoxyribonuclease RuvC